ncbi:glycoside hydrolase family 10 protein [Pleurocapsa sp. PCC 7319]|uniref:glycoside hydrolase family 10 protein n=1 Tax=Pleurocapsa sp. PCC 7319 TaxID=118161 RepID=UPI000347EA93|nr:family 10 glycosylhydrolase [Pleurocapsa sp. PCC 7319]
MSEIRGVWIANRPHSKVLESRENIVETLDFLQFYGFNVIFPVVWNRGYTLYPSQVMSKYKLPIIDPYYEQQQRDPLAEIIHAAHQHNIKVIPWLEYGFAASHLLSGGHILQQYSHWEAIDREGKIVRHGGLTWMNSFDPEVQQFMLEIIREIISTYCVDGIQGCDRLPALPVTAGYDDKTSALYQAEFGKTPPSNPKNQQWIQWRANLLTDFLARVYQEVKAINPQAIISLSPAVYPFCLTNLLQDSKTWVARGLVDIIHPQIYRSSFFGYNQEVKKLIKTYDRNSLTKFAPGIAFTANGKDVTIKDLIKCIKTNRDHHLSGQVFFHYEGLRKNNDQVAIALTKLANYNQIASLPRQIDSNT